MALVEIRMKQAIAGTGLVARPGQVVRFPADEAERLVACGAAEYLTAAAPVPAGKKAAASQKAALPKPETRTAAPPAPPPTPAKEPA